jgi:hypothetical protein
MKYWRKYIKAGLLSRGLRLSTALGPWTWTDYDIWPWLYSPSQDALVHIQPNGTLLAHIHAYPFISHHTYSHEGRIITQLPKDLLKASVRRSKSNSWWMIDNGPFTKPSPLTQYDCFFSYINNFSVQNLWCYEYLDIPSHYVPLINDIKNGEVWIISDGSYDPASQCGTAAWIIEGTSTLQITGQVITTGAKEVQSAYRSELTGILAAITVISNLAYYHSLNMALTILCDCEKGIQQVFYSSKPITLNDSCNDLLKAIRHKISCPHIRWSGSHIKGHQDDSVPFEQLTRPSQLNVIVDIMAKEFLAIARDSQDQHDVKSPSWSIRIGSTPLINDFDQTLYDLVHTLTVKQYWIRKSRINDQQFSSVDWPRLSSALDKMSLARRFFCSKHSSGMCGAGKFQKIWKLRETDSCPHCGRFEDSEHVWKCQAQQVKDVWKKSLSNLKSTLRKLDTDPDLITCILIYLNTWRNNDCLQTINRHKYHCMMELQDTIGARQFFEGWVHN